MLSALILSRHSYPAVPLAGQLADQWSVHSGPLVTNLILIKFKIKLVPCFQGRRLFLHPSELLGEGGGILPVQTVTLCGVIRCCTSPSIFQLKSLRGQTKRSKQFFSCFFLLCNVILLLHTQREFYQQEQFLFL